MGFPLYLAMTVAEMLENGPLPPNFAYMACHFSPYGTGLSNLPTWLPAESMLILNDRTPIRGHDPDLICDQLAEVAEAWHCRSLLLDFQQPDCEETAILARKLIRTLPCPVGLSAVYAKDLPCPVFLPPPPLDVPLERCLALWQGREIWLEAVLDGAQLTLTDEGCRSTPIPYPSLSGGFADEALHCHYHIQTEESAAHFTLYRTRQDLYALLEEAASLGVTQAVGLWQELSQQESFLPDPRLPNA